MAYSYAQLVQAIEDTTENTEASFVAHIPDFVTQTEKDVYNRVQALAARKNQTGVMAAGNRYVVLPTDWLSTFSFAYIDTSGNYHYLLNKEPDFIREAYPLPTTTGAPAYYALYDISTMVVGPTPDQSYSIEINYYGYPTSIVTASTSWLGNNFEHVLLYGSLRYAYTYMKGEPELVKQYSDLFESALSELKVLVDGKNRRDSYRSGQTRVQVP
jgi:hypothetical protein